MFPFLYIFSFITNVRYVFIFLVLQNRLFF